MVVSTFFFLLLWFVTSGLSGPRFVGSGSVRSALPVLMVCRRLIV
jgi:hypothetical protein